MNANVKQKKLREKVGKFAECAVEAPADARSVYFAKVSERERQRWRECVRRTMPGAMDVGFHQMERVAMEGAEKLTEAVERDPAETSAAVDALFPGVLDGKTPR